LAVLLLTNWPGALCAQTVQPFTDIAVTREHRADDRPAGKPFYYISREDCLAGDVLNFDLDISGPDPAYTFQVWASDGENCTDDDERSIDEGECWLVYAGTIGTTSTDVRIPVQNIAAAKRPRATSGSVSTGDESSCANDIDVGITLYFMHVGGGAVVGGAAATWQTRLDLKGPAAPTGVEAGIGDKRLVVSWDVVMGDKNGYKIYCEESTTAVSELSGRYAQLQAAQSLTDGGIGGATTAVGGTGGSPTSVTPAAPSSSAAPSSAAAPATPTAVPSGGAGGTTGGSTALCATNLVQGALPPADAQVCGEVDVASSERGTASGLTNSVVYAIAVSAVDDLGNPGPLSNVDCEAPEDLDEFFEAYRRQGGAGGGGFCSISRHGARVAWAALIGLCALLGLVLWRRR
jgi:hypothetical protein